MADWSVQYMLVRLPGPSHHPDKVEGPMVTPLSSHAEYCLAIVVGSMPAFSTFLKLHAIQSRALQALRSTFGVGSGRSTKRLSGRGSSPERPLHGTIGSPAAKKKRRGYYDLTDTMILDSRYTVQGGEDGNDRPVQPGHILRTMDIRQSDDSRSTDNPV